MSVVTIEREGRIAVVRFDRGDKANAMSHEVMQGLLDAARGAGITRTSMLEKKKP